MSSRNNPQQSPFGLLEEDGDLQLPVGEEPQKDDQLNKILDPNEAAIQITSPYSGEKVDTVGRQRASLNILDERSVGQAMRAIDDDIDDLKLLVQSPGGRVSTASKISGMIDQNFDNVEVYVPHFAKSGGTLISLTGQEIVMAQESDLGPLDPQMPAEGGSYSATDLVDSYHRVLQEMDKVHPGKASAPEHSLIEDMDNLKYEECMKMIATLQEYTADILKGHEQIPEHDAEVYARQMVRGFPIHGYTLTADEVQQVLPEQMVTEESERPEEMQTMRTWMDQYAFDEGSNHVVAYHQKTE
jgi:ATP-dependent protease ClpP protease subunit